jgi:outer membrane protein OmpA-like peptidoglycan-associated protein
VAAALAVLALVGVLALLPVLSNDDGDAAADDASTLDRTALEAESPVEGSDSDVVTTNAAPTTEEPDRAEAPVTTVRTRPSTTTAPTTTTTEPTTTTVAPTTTTIAPASGAVTYPTLPDGSPEPIVAVFDVETITLTGTAPSAEAVAQLETLAIANSQFPDAKIVNQIEVNPAVPVNVGVRVIELNSPRFPEGSSTVGPEHGAQLNRVAVVMNALPNVTVMVVGHRWCAPTGGASDLRRQPGLQDADVRGRGAARLGSLLLHAWCPSGARPAARARGRPCPGRASGRRAEPQLLEHPLWRRPFGARRQAHRQR